MEVIKALNHFRYIEGFRYEYIIVCSNRLKLVELYFEHCNFKHLCGFKYLRDRPKIVGFPSDKFCEALLNGRIKENTILSSQYYNPDSNGAKSNEYIIKKRIELISRFDEILCSADSLFLDFKNNYCNQKQRQSYSKIVADIQIKEIKSDSRIFIKLDNTGNGISEYVPVSCFVSNFKSYDNYKDYKVIFSSKFHLNTKIRCIFKNNLRKPIDFNADHLSIDNL